MGITGGLSIALDILFNEGEGRAELGRGSFPKTLSSYTWLLSKKPTKDGLRIYRRKLYEPVLYAFGQQIL